MRPSTHLSEERAAHTDTKQKGAAALKAEKEAHKSTQKELTDTKKLLADSEHKLAEVQQLAKATEAAS